MGEEYSPQHRLIRPSEATLRLVATLARCENRFPWCSRRQHASRSTPRPFFYILILVIFSQLFIKGAGAESMKPSAEKATFAGGCFWGIEKLFSELDGVVSTRVGYTGGHVKNPNYEMVCTGVTGHAEAIEITYDPSKTSYGKLLEYFFTYHDPTTVNRQGNDMGTQYRSAIFYHSGEQKKHAAKAIELLARTKVFKNEIVTQVEPAGEFYPAEDHHQKYLKKNPNGYCSIHFQSHKIAEVLKQIE